MKILRAAILGTFYPRAEHEKERGPRFAEIGRAFRRSVPASGMPPPIGYELTSEGKAALGG